MVFRGWTPFDMNAPFDAPLRFRELEEKQRAAEAQRRFLDWCESDEGKRLIRDAYERAKAAAPSENNAG